MSTLTPSQKITLYNIHSQYMTNISEVSLRDYDPKYCSELRAKFFKMIEELGLTLREAETLSWEINRSYHAILMQAVEDGYTSEFVKPENIPYIAREAAKETRIA